MLIVRTASPDDLSFILDSFVRDYVRVPYARGLQRSQVRQLMVSLLASSGWTCSIVCDDETPEEIIAYAVHRGPQEIAWTHAKALYRGRGMVRQLLAQIGATRTEPVLTPFAPAPQQCRAMRARGWRLHHRPWMGLL